MTGQDLGGASVGGANDPNASLPRRTYRPDRVLDLCVLQLDRSRLQARQEFVGLRGAELAERWSAQAIDECLRRGIECHGALLARVRLVGPLHSTGRRRRRSRRTEFSTTSGRSRTSSACSATTTVTCSSRTSTRHDARRAARRHPPRMLAELPAEVEDVLDALPAAEAEILRASRSSAPSTSGGIGPDLVWRGANAPCVFGLDRAA